MSGNNGHDNNLDPNQTYILSGPYVRYDPATMTYMGVFAAKPVPRGMTVIATPTNHRPALVPSTAATPINPDAAPFVPRTTTPAAAVNALPMKNKAAPCFMYWSSECPEGKLVPMRQPQPPVYFQPQNQSAIKSD